MREAQYSAMEEARAEIGKLISTAGPETTVAVAFTDLGSGHTLFINERVSLHAASTMKVPVMMGLFRLVDEGKLKLGDELPVANEFRSIADGSPFSVEDDSDTATRELIGRSAGVEFLLRRMITRSGNLATNLLIERVTTATITAVMREIGAHDIRVLRGVEDGPAFRSGLNNTVTAYDLMLCMKAIETGQGFSAASRQKMLDILLAQEFNEAIPAGLPPATRVAHKTGSITRIGHDVAIVYPAKGSPYILVVLTAGIEKDTASHKLIAEIARLLHQNIE
jgi:beta-lactamase class A